MNSTIRHLLSCITLLGCSCIVFAQVEESGLTQDSTLLEQDIYFAEGGKKNEEGFFAMFEGNPGRAALYSAIIPGAGQLYNRKWLKAPIVWGLEGTAIVLIGFYSKEHQRFDLGYKGVVRGELPSFEGYTDSAGLKQVRDRLRKYRDYSIIGLSVIHVLNIADAFVDRHLLEFDVDEDISLQLGPTQHGVGFTMSFN